MTLEKLQFIATTPVEAKYKTWWFALVEFKAPWEGSECDIQLAM